MIASHFSSRWKTFLAQYTGVFIIHTQRTSHTQCQRVITHRHPSARRKSYRIRSSAVFLSRLYRWVVRAHDVSICQRTVPHTVSKSYVSNQHSSQLRISHSSYSRIINSLRQPTNQPINHQTEVGDLHFRASRRPSHCLAIPAFSASLGSVTDTWNCNWDCAYANDLSH